MLISPMANISSIALNQLSKVGGASHNRFLNIAFLSMVWLFNRKISWFIDVFLRQKNRKCKRKPSVFPHRTITITSNQIYMGWLARPDMSVHWTYPLLATSSIPNIYIYMFILYFTLFLLFLFYTHIFLEHQEAVVASYPPESRGTCFSEIW